MSPQTGLFAADFGEEVASVAPDDHVRSQPSESDSSRPTSYRYHPLHSTFRHILKRFCCKSSEIVRICENSCEETRVEICIKSLLLLVDSCFSYTHLLGYRFALPSPKKWRCVRPVLSCSLLCARVLSSGRPVLQDFRRDLIMEWTTPRHEEIDLNCEVSSYANAEL